ncbi:MAG: hypothetical protein ACLFU2_11620 [Opitutales bacterium]
MHEAFDLPHRGREDAAMTHEPRTDGEQTAAVSPWLSWWLIAASAFLAAYVQTNLAWNHFHRGAPVLDPVGWYLALVHEVGLTPGNTPWREWLLPATGEAVHVAPSLRVLAIITKVLPIGPVLWVSVLEGMKGALIVLCVGAALRRRWAQRQTPWGEGPGPSVVALVLAAVAAPFLVAGIEPSASSWVIPGALGTCYAAFTGRMGWAWAAGFATAGVREEMGAVLAVLLAVVVLQAWLQRPRWDEELRGWATLAGALAAWSVAALTLHFGLSGAQAGESPGPGDAPGAVFEAGRWFVNHAWLWAPVGVLLIWAGVGRRVWVLTGLIMLLPWALGGLLSGETLQAFEASEWAVPVALALLWPVVGLFAFERGSPWQVPSFSWVGGALAASLVAWAPLIIDRPAGAPAPSRWTHLFVPERQSGPALQATVDFLGRAQRWGRPLRVDDSWVALDPGRLANARFSPDRRDDVELVAFFLGGGATRAAWEASQALPYRYRVGATEAFVLSAEALNHSQLTLLSESADSLLPFLEQEGQGVWSLTRFERARSVTRGPDWELPLGTEWELVWQLEADLLPGFEEQPIRLEVVGEAGERVLAAAEIDLSGPGTRDGRLRFELPRDLMRRDIELRLTVPPATRGRLLEMRLLPAASEEAR